MISTDFHIQDWAELRVSTDQCIIIKCNEELSFLNVLREASIGAEFGQFLLFRKFL